ncbi:MAG: ChuX/HutX family heme-like substrate-binding protein [Pseudomonadota bacterium]
MTINASETDRAPTSDAIRAAWSQSSKIRERDFAEAHGITEAGLADALVGHGNARIRVDLDALFAGLRNVGQIMALSRNDGAVHEKVGSYVNYRANRHASMVLGPDIDLRIFPRHWHYSFHVTKSLEDGTTRRSFQFFDQSGAAVHKVFERHTSDSQAWNTLLEELSQGAPVGELAFEPAHVAAKPEPLNSDARAKLHAAWSALEDTHQFQQMLRQQKVDRLLAIEAVEGTFTRRLASGTLETLFTELAKLGLPVMVFVRNSGVLQIHSGPVENIKMAGPWLNVIDDGFHMHLKTDLAASIWAVRKPTKRGDIWSLEAFSADGRQIILVNGYRREGDDHAEITRWNELLTGQHGPHNSPKLHEVAQ